MPIWGGMGTIFGVYKIDNLQIDGFDVVVNKPRTAAYRAPGTTMAIFATETVMDEIAVRLGIDPLEIRLINVAKEGDRRPDGPIYPRIGFFETLEAVRDHPHYSAPLEGHNRGRGLAIGMWGNYGGKSSASASVINDGTISLLEGSVDIGGSRTSIAMQLAETLQIPATDVKPQVVDTDSVGYTEGTYGSRTTFATGWAAYELGCDLVRQLVERAAKLWEIDPELVSYSVGVFTANGRSMTFKELAGQLDNSGSPVVASVSAQPSGYGPAASAQIVDVEVDPETGKVDVLRYTVVQDAGTAIHPSYVEGQLQGGAAQGIGWAINEAYIYDEKGRLKNSNLLDYRLPTALDLPMIDTVIVEVPNPGHPYGVRGVGEAPITSPPAALANAIYRAIGIRMTELPMSPNRILEMLKNSSDHTK
jgi:CO/xanthine dehydrogenase Mo-binding subunit